MYLIFRLLVEILNIFVREANMSLLNKCDKSLTRFYNGDH